MSKSFSYCLSLILVGLAALGSTGCVDKPTSGGTGGTSLYLFDNSSGSVKVWSDVNQLYTATSAPSPDREITGNRLKSRVPLAWGGMALDTSSNRLYLVSANGGVVTRIERVSSQNGALSQDTDVVTFTLGDPNNDRFSGGSVFGQASVNASGSMLYVAETSTDRNSTRIWKISNPGSLVHQSTVAKDSSTITVVADDNGTTGVAAGSGNLLYAFFTNGDTITDGFNQNGQDGARLRVGSTSGFAAKTNVVVGATTQLTDTTTTYGSLAYDSGNNLVYVCRQANSSNLNAVLAFTADQVSGNTLNPAPAKTLGETAAKLSNLRIIAHPGFKDWLAGADALSDVASNTLYLWKSPSTGGSATPVTLGSDVQIRGLALDGTN